MTSKQILMSAAGFSGESYWINTLGGANSDAAYGIGSDSSGNIYIVGNTSSQGTGDGDCFIAKYDSSGVLQWQKALGINTGGANSEYFQSCAVDSSGNVYAVGRKYLPTPTTYSLLLVKYDTSGTLQWQKILNTSSSFYANGIGVALDSSGNPHVCGSTSSTNHILIAKYNTSGVVQWQRQLASSYLDIANGIVVDSSGNVFVTGYSRYTNGTTNSFMLVKYNSSGTLQWQKSLSTAISGLSIVLDSSGNIYTNAQGALYKFDSSGAILWQKSLPISVPGVCNSLAIDSANNLYIAGYATIGTQEVVIAKYNSSGTLQWQRSLGGSGVDNGYGVTVLSLASIAISGTTRSAGAGGADCLIVKLPSDGSLTGTYGSFTYAASSLTETTPTRTITTPTLSGSTTTLGEGNAGFTQTTTTLTSTKTTIQ